MLLFLLSVILFSLASPLTFAQSSTLPTTSGSLWSDRSFLQNIIVTILAAILAFLSGYTLSQINQKRSVKLLPYNLEIDTGLVNMDREIKDKVKVFYEGQEIENLSHVKIDLENTGNSAIKSEEIRFEFLQETRILDFYFDPVPEPEMKVEKIRDPNLREFECKCRVGNIGRDGKLGVRFIVTGDSAVEPKLHSYNENDDVKLVSRATTKILSNKEKVSKFLSLLIMYFVVPPVFNFFGSPLSSLMAGIVRIPLLFFMFRFIVPFSEVIAELISKLLNLEEKPN